MAVLIFWDSFELGYNPRLLIKIIAICDLWKNGRMVNLDNGALLLLFFVDLVEDAIIFLKLLAKWEYIINFNLAHSIAVVVIIVILVDLKVKYRRTIRLYHSWYVTDTGE